MTKIARILRLITNCSTVEDIDYAMEKLRVRCVKLQKRSIAEQNHDDYLIKQAQEHKKAQEKVQKSSEKRIFALNDLLDDY